MHTNRLIGETSPYLLQHAHNPVDWFPWAEEAFERALQDGVVLSGSVYHDLVVLAEELQAAVEPPIEVAAGAGTSEGE